MDPDIISFAVVAAVIVGMAASLSVIGVYLFRAIRKTAPASRFPDVLQYDQRFDQLQQSVDAIAVEVERIAEAQRFSARLLAERSETATLPR
ncbi:MAG: hypothetical protein ACJ793_02300 [Gemmatimonadaceae bacterium]